MNEEFNKWYDTYESDGQELLCHNAIDLEFAFLAGAEAQKRRDVEIAENYESGCKDATPYDRGKLFAYGAMAAAIERGQR